MNKLQRSDLMPLETYHETRADFRRQVMEHKANRQLALGDHATLYFEDRLTIQYQIQEMLRIEKIFESDAIQEELDAYNPLIPDGDNWKATFMIEYPDIDERREALTKLVGIEDRVWMQIEGYDRVYAIADEDLERDTEEKTSAVHFVRFQLTPEMTAAARAGAAIGGGIEHDNYLHTQSPLAEAVQTALRADLS